MAINSFRQLHVWQKSFELAKDVYGYCEKLPTSERFGLASQMQRSSVSIPSNIAEGQQRNNRKEYRQFIGMAKGSAAELETQLLLAEAIHQANNQSLRTKLSEVQKMLHSLSKRLHSTPTTKTTTLDPKSLKPNTYNQ